MNNSSEVEKGRCPRDEIKENSFDQGNITRTSPSASFMNTTFSDRKHSWEVTCATISGGVSIVHSALNI